jgi:hypothetical protein
MEMIKMEMMGAGIMKMARWRENTMARMMTMILSVALGVLVARRTDYRAHSEHLVAGCLVCLHGFVISW